MPCSMVSSLAVATASILSPSSGTGDMLDVTRYEQDMFAHGNAECMLERGLALRREAGMGVGPEGV
jgi:hypothetical protein